VHHPLAPGGGFRATPKVPAGGVRPPLGPLGVARRLPLAPKGGFRATPTPISGWQRGHPWPLWVAASHPRGGAEDDALARQWVDQNTWAMFME